MSDFYWHFVREDGRLGYNDNRQVVPGATYRIEGQPELCRKGLHASEGILDALGYAPGPLLCKVSLGGEILVGDDKVVATERTVIEMADVSKELRMFARKCALDVIHLWDAPQVVIDYLTTGDESLRDAARDAAWAAARDAAWAAARDAAWAAARDAARAAAWDAAWATAWDAAWATAWDAARDKQRGQLLDLLAKAYWRTT